MKGLVSVIVSTYNKPDYLALTKPLRDGGQRTLILRFVSTTVE